MSVDMLHMTVAFLHNYNKIDKRMAKRQIDEIIGSFEDDEILEFVGYSLFPEHKQNLIVAKYKVSEKFTKKVIQLKDSLGEHFTIHFA